MMVPIATGAAMDKAGFPGAEASAELAYQLRISARYDEANHVYEQAIAVASAQPPQSGSLALADLLTQRGILYKEIGRYAEAEVCYQRALAIVERESTVGDTRLADLYHNLGGLEHARRRPARGEAYARRAVEVRIEALGDNHPDVAFDTAALAAVLDAQGKYDEAEQLYHRALVIFRRLRSHFDVAVNLNNLAALYQARGEAVRPEKLYKRALVIKEKLFGARHPEIATTLNNLALFYKAVGRYADARALYERVLGILQESFGPAHPSTTTCVYNYAQLLKAQSAELEQRSACLDRDREEMAASEPPPIQTEFTCFRLAARPSKIHRWGVYAEEPIPRGRKVIEYTGERISNPEIVRRTSHGPRLYVFRLNKHWGIDGASGGSGAEYINHCCEPNLYSRTVRGHILYVSRRAIQPGEELTVDYRFSQGCERTPCYCGARTCRGTINVSAK
jgi:tetratricopeptide (TPR) repeat protein